MPHKYIVDRIEGKYAVVTDDMGKTRDVPLSVLPPNIQAGDTIWFNNGNYLRDETDTIRRRMRVQEKMDHLFIE